jgi:two-component sensor histidine kinase/ligand-binding sensor domain-containing protein
MKDGLSHRQINGILIGKQGFVWLTTKNGLNRFDGYNFKVYNAENSGLPFSHMERASEDAIGDLWIIGDLHIDENLAIFNPETGKVTSPIEKTGLREKVHVNFINAMSDSTILFGQTTDTFFYTWHPRKGSRKFKYPVTCRLLMSLPAQNCFMAKVGSDELCKIDMNGNLVQKIKTPFIIDISYSDINGKGAYILDSISRHVFYVSTNLEVMDVNTSLPPFDTTFQDYVFSVNVDNVIWRQGKLFKPGANIIRDFPAEGMIELRNRIRDRKADSSGKIWIANDFGLYMLSVSKNKFKRYFYADGKTAGLNSYRGILVDSGDLYACNEFSGVKYVNIYSGKTWKSPFKTPAAAIAYFDIVKTSKGELLGFSGEDVFSFDKNGSRFSFYTLPAEVHQKLFWKIVEIQPGHFLLGTHYGLRWFNMANREFSLFGQYNNYPQLANGVVLDIVPNGNGRYWLCSNIGLFEYDAKLGIVDRYSSLDTGDHFLPALEFQHCLYDYNVLWLATTNGLIKWDVRNNHYKLFTKKDGLSNENIYAVYNDRQNRLWMSCDYGIMCMDKETYKIKTYLTNSGITHNEFNRTSHYKDDSGNIYFGSLNGITALNPKDFPEIDDTRGAELVVTSYQQFNGKTNRLEDKTTLLLAEKSITLQPDDRFFTINFALLNYDDVMQNTYYWKIDGVDTGWNSMRDHVLRLSRLPYGNRVLRIKAQSGDGNWSRNELRFSLHVIKPLYLRAWFIVLATMAIAAGVAFLYKTRVKRLQKENIKLDKIVKEKTAGLEVTIQDLKESFEQKDILMKEIHHRVKNNLQVISVLLKLQLENVADGVARKSLEESMSRISSIALIHQYLYKNEDLTVINISTYIAELFQQIEEVYRTSNEKVTLANNIPHALLDIDTAVPLGIILNELLVNSYKYAFKGRHTGQINIELVKSPTHYTLLYNDDGPGLPSDYNLRKANSLGMTIVKSLALQLKGEATYNAIENRFYITFRDTAMRKNIA